MAAAAAKNILVTGGNAGIGLALCRQLVADHGAKVFMGARSAERGVAGMKQITDAHPDCAGRIEVLSIDVSDDASVAAAAGKLKAKGVTLYALVNNAGRTFALTLLMFNPAAECFSGGGDVTGGGCVACTATAGA